jgi:hypothetical protein
MKIIFTNAVSASKKTHRVSEDYCLWGCDSMDFHLFIYGLFNGTASSSGYIVSNGRIISELERIWEEVVLAQSRNLPDTCFEELRKTRENLGKDIRRAGRDSVRIPPECASEALPPEPTCVETP